MSIQKITAGITGQEAADIIYNNDIQSYDPNNRNILKDSSLAFLGTDSSPFFVTKQTGTPDYTIETNNFTAQRLKVSVAVGQRIQLVQSGILISANVQYSLGVFVRLLAGTTLPRFVITTTAGSNTPLPATAIDLADGWKFLKYEGYAYGTDTSASFYVDYANVSGTTSVIAEVAAPMMIIGDFIAPKVWLNYDYAINTLQKQAGLYSQNWYKDSSLLLLNQSNSPNRLIKQAGNPTFEISNSDWAGNQVTVTAAAGDRGQLIQTMTFEAGDVISFGFYFKRVSGTKDPSITFVPIGGTGVYYPGKVVSGIDDWLFCFYEGYTMPLTGTVYIYIEVDNRTGTDETVRTIAFPMLVKSDKININQRDGLTEAVRQLLQGTTSSNNPWKGLEWISYGNSITAIGNGTQTAPFNITDGASWQILVSAILEFSKHYGRGIGGQSFTWNTSTWYANADGSYNSRPPAEQPAGTTVHLGAYCSWDRITTMIPQNFIGLIFIMGGTNDFGKPVGGDPSFIDGSNVDTDWSASSLYTGGDYDINTYKGGIASTVMKIQTWCPDAIVVLGDQLSGRAGTGKNMAVDANGNTPLDLSKMLRDVAQYMSVPVINVFGTTGINQVNRDRYLSDSVHPYTRNGREALARAVIAGIKNVYPRIFQ